MNPNPMTDAELEMWHAKFAAASLERIMRACIPTPLPVELPRRPAVQEAA